MPLTSMLHKSFRLIASICVFSIGVSQPVPAHALRPHVDQSGLEERLGIAGLREALNEQTWNQLRHFSRRMEALGVPWEAPVEIAGVWADVDRTQTHPELDGNGLSPSLVESYAWILHRGGTVGAISAAPYRVVDLLDAGFIFPASMDQRVVGRIQAAVASQADMKNLRVLARSGGFNVRFSSQGQASITSSPVQFLPEEITRISRALTVAAFHAIHKKFGADLSKEIGQVEQAPDVLSIARILRDVERAHGLILLEGITPLEIDGGMIFLSFKDDALNPEEILAEAVPVIGETLGQRPLYFIRGPMYVAVSLFEKADVLKEVMDEPSEKPGIWIVAGDGPRDDLKMLKMAAGSQRLVLSYFVGPPDAVAVTDAVVVPYRRRFVKATEWFLNEMVSAARDRRSYADLRFIAGEITPRELADALGIPLSGFSAKIREMPYSEAAALLARAGLEEAVFPKPEPVPSSTPSLRSLGLIDKRGGSPFPLGVGPSLTTFQREGEDIRVFFDLDPDVPAELLNGDGSERFKTLLDGRYLDGENVDPVLRKELREILKKAQSIYVRYKPASTGPEMQMEMIPVNVSLREALVQRSGVSKVLHITYEARIPAQRGTMNFAFFGLVTFQDGRQLRLADSGWVRNLDPVSLGLQKAPRAVWRDPLPNGDEVQLALYEGQTAPLWREPAGRRESALESAVSRAMREAQRHPHVTVRVDVGRKAGVSSGSPSEVEFLFTGNLPGLFPLDSNNGPTEHLRVSEEEVWTELRLRHRRAMFVLQAGKAAAAPQGSPGQPSALVTEGNRVVQLLKDNGYPDYNAWVVVGEGENVQLFIVPRDPRTNRDGGVVVAPQDYWAVPLAIDGRYVLLTAEELEQFNLASTVYTGSFRNPLLKRGDPILPVSINSLGEQGLLITSDPRIFHDDRYLEARIDLATRLSGVPLNDPGIQAVRQSLKDNSPLNPGDRARQEVLADLARTVENVDQYIRWLERIQGWEPRHVSAFGRLEADQQNAFTGRVLELGRRFAEEPAGRVEIRTLQRSPRTAEPLPIAPTENVWAYLDVGGGTQDVMINLIEQGDAKKVVLGLTEGGPANQVVRAFHALQIPTSLLSQNDPVRISLFLLRPGKREVRLVPRPAVSLSVDTLHAVAGQLPDLSKGAPSAGRFGAVVIGERIGDSELPFALELAQEAQAAQRKGYAVHLFANSGWSPNVWEALLSAHPRTVFSPYSALANLIGESNPESLRDDLQGRIRAATQADRIRRAHGVREWIVYLETGGLILVTDNGWWHLLPSSQDRLNYSSGAAGAAYAAYLAATSRSVLGSSSRGDLHVAAAEDAVRQSAIFMSQDADNWGKSATREQLAQEHHPEVLNLPIPRDVQEERRVYFAERMAAAEAGSRAQQIQRIRDFFAAFPAVPVQPNFTHYLPWLLDLRKLEVTLDQVFTEWDDLPLRREVIAKLSAIPPPAEPQPSYRLVQRLLRASLADSDPETRSLARQYWQSVEQAAGERILTALRNQNSGPIQVGYDSALLSWVSGEQLRYAASQLAGAAQTEVRVAELGALAERLPNERGISLLVPVEESVADRDAQGYPLPNPAVPTAAFPPTESRATLYAEYVRRLISPRVLGVYPVRGSRPQDQAVLERTFLLAAAWASLPKNPGPADPVAAALRQYYWTLFSLTVLPEDEALLTQKTEDFARARQKDTVVKKLAIQSSAAVFTALAPESEPPAETEYILEELLHDLDGRLRHLTDVRRGQRIVVVPLAVLQQFPILEDFLVRLPRESAETVLVWRTEQAEESSLDRNAHLGSFTGSSLDLRDFLQGQLRSNSVDVVSVLGDEETAAFLRQALAGLGREIRVDFVMGIRGILHALGVPGYEVEKADPEEIERSLQIIRDA